MWIFQNRQLTLKPKVTMCLKALSLSLLCLLLQDSMFLSITSLWHDKCPLEMKLIMKQPLATLLDQGNRSLNEGPVLCQICKLPKVHNAEI